MLMHLLHIYQRNFAPIERNIFIGTLNYLWARIFDCPITLQMICLKKDVLANFFHFASAASLFAKFARSPFFLLRESARRKGECGARFMVCPEKARRRGKPPCAEPPTSGERRGFPKNHGKSQATARRETRKYFNLWSYSAYICNYNIYIMKFLRNRRSEIIIISL